MLIYWFFQYSAPTISLGTEHSNIAMFSRRCWTSCVQHSLKWSFIHKEMRDIWALRNSIYFGASFHACEAIIGDLWPENGVSHHEWGVYKISHTGWFFLKNGIMSRGVKIDKKKKLLLWSNPPKDEARPTPWSLNMDPTNIELGTFNSLTPPTKQT